MFRASGANRFMSMKRKEMVVFLKVAREVIPRTGRRWNTDGRDVSFRSAAEEDNKLLKENQHGQR